MKKIENWRFWKTSFFFFWVSHFDFFFQHFFFFFLLHPLLKESKVLGEQGWSKFWWLLWFPAKNHPHQTFMVQVYHFVPVGLETYGAYGPQGIKINKKNQDATSEKLSTFYLFQSISMAIQKGNAVCVMVYPKDYYSSIQFSSKGSWELWWKENTEGPRLTRFLGLGKNRVTWNSC